MRYANDINLITKHTDEQDESNANKLVDSSSYRFCVHNIFAIEHTQIAVNLKEYSNFKRTFRTHFC